MNRRKFFKGLAGLLIAGSAAKATGVFDGEISGVMVADQDLTDFDITGDCTYQGYVSAESGYASDAVVLSDGFMGITARAIPRDGKFHKVQVQYDARTRTTKRFVDGKRV